VLSLPDKWHVTILHRSLLGVDAIVHALLDSGNDARLTQPGMALVADLHSDLEKGFALHGALRELGRDRWWWRPRFWLEPGREFRAHVRIQIVCFRALAQRLGTIVGLGRIDHTHGKAGLSERGDQGNPIGRGCFQDDQNSLGGCRSLRIRLTVTLAQ